MSTSKISATVRVNNIINLCFTHVLMRMIINFSYQMTWNYTNNMWDYYSNCLLYSLDATSTSLITVIIRHNAIFYLVVLKTTAISTRTNKRTKFFIATYHIIISTANKTIHRFYSLGSTPRPHLALTHIVALRFVASRQWNIPLPERYTQCFGKC